MCDRDHSIDPAALELSRRRFAVLGLATTLAACATNGTGPTGGIVERNVVIPTGDGMMDAFFVAPRGRASAAVIFWPDIAGLRPAFQAMARRMAADGFAVLVANQYYRWRKAPIWQDFAEFRTKGGFQAVGPWRQGLTPAAIATDTRAMVTWLDQQREVDRGKGIGVQGYCMGGPFTVRSAVAVPGRVRAAASFHGGGLVTDKADSPHRVLGQSRASFLFAISRDDDAKAPNDKVALREAAAAAGRPAEIEVYDGDHGWTVLDSPAYAQPAAERAYARLLALYRAAL